MVTILIYSLIVLAQIFIVCRNKTVSIKELLQVFLVGSTTAIFANFLIQGIAVRFIGSEMVSYTVGPVAEEVLKIVFVFFLLYFTKMGKSVSVEDGILLGAAAGAGFGFAEDSVRAIGLGLQEMNELFPSFNLSALPSLLVHWLPNERGTDLPGGQGIIVGHLMWTALVGAGLGFARKISPKLSRGVVIPLALLVWVTFDHAIGNFGSYNLNPILKGFYLLYGRGWGIWWGLTLAIIGAIIVDEKIIKKHLPQDEKMLLPGEKKRSLLGETYLTLLNFNFGWRYFQNSLHYVSLRRQLAFIKREEADVNEFETKILEQKNITIATARLPGNIYPQIPQTITALWQGPPPNWSRLKLDQKLKTLMMTGLLLTTIYTLWLFLFSVYFPPRFVSLILNSPITLVLGIIGYIGAAFTVFEYYRRKKWQQELKLDSRLDKYTDALLTNTSGISIVFSLPFFTGEHPLLVDKFLWGQLTRMLEQMREARKWVGGTVSGAIGFIPGVGEIKSGAEAWYGYDHIADKPVEGWDRVFAGLGAVPIAGGFIRGFRNGTKAMKAIENINDIAGKVSFSKTVREDMEHAFNELSRSVNNLPGDRIHDLARSRDNMLEEWSQRSGLTKQAPGHYRLKLISSDTEVFVGPDGLKAMNAPDSLSDIGQVTLDHATQTVFFDKVSPQITPDKFSQINPNDLKTLQKLYPKNTIMQQTLMGEGFGKMTVLTPDGQTNQFWIAGRSIAVSSR